MTDEIVFYWMCTLTVIVKYIFWWRLMHDRKTVSINDKEHYILEY